MDVKVRISRTWQQEQFQPITVDIEVVEHDSTDFDKTYKALYEKVEAAVVEAEVKMRDMYTPDERKPEESTEEDWDKPIELTREPKKRTAKQPNRSERTRRNRT